MQTAINSVCPIFIFNSVNNGHYLVPGDLIQRLESQFPWILVSGDSKVFQRHDSNGS